MLFYAPGDGNWWLGECPENFLSWSLAGNTQGKSPGQPDFGNIADGRPIWTGHFTGSALQEVIFYFPGDGNWWFASCAGPTYRIYSLDLDAGAILESAALGDRGTVGRPTFDPTRQDQRGALNLANGWIYASFADFAAFDLGAYHAGSQGSVHKTSHDSSTFRSRAPYSAGEPGAQAEYRLRPMVGCTPRRATQRLLITPTGAVSGPNILVTTETISKPSAASTVLEISHRSIGISRVMPER